MIPRANPMSAPRKAAMITTLSEDALVVPANKKPTYAMHRVHKIRRKLIAGLPPGGIVLRTDANGKRI
jgi:hypothetical protein